MNRAGPLFVCIAATEENLNETGRQLRSAVMEGVMAKSLNSGKPCQEKRSGSSIVMSTDGERPAMRSATSRPLIGPRLIPIIA